MSSQFEKNDNQFVLLNMDGQLGFESKFGVFDSDVSRSVCCV